METQNPTIRLAAILDFKMAAIFTHKIYKKLDISTSEGHRMIEMVQIFIFYVLFYTNGDNKSC